MLPSKEYFTTYNEYNGEVALGDNSLKLPIIGIGNTSILNDVLHVPDLSMGLISISQLDTTGHVTLFKHSKVYILIGMVAYSSPALNIRAYRAYII